MSRKEHRHEADPPLADCSAPPPAPLARPSSASGRRAAAEFSLQDTPTTSRSRTRSNIRALEAIDRIKEETDGRIEIIQIFPQSQLGADTDVLSQVRSRRRRVLHALAADPLDLRAERLAQRHRLRLQGLSSGLEGDGRRARRLCPRPDRGQGHSRRHGQDLGQRLPPDHDLDRADRDARPISRTSRSACRSARSGPRCSPPSAVGADLASTSPRSTPRCRPASSTARRTRSPSSSNCQALGGAEVRLDDQPHVGRLLDAGEPPRLGARCRRICSEIVAKNFNASAVERARRHRDAQRGAPGRARGEGHGLQRRPMPAPFRRRCVEAGFYAEWKGKFGDEAWAILENATGLTLG